MQLTSEFLQQYVGGQLEIQNQDEGYLYRGEIKEAKVNGDDLNITLAWLAKGEGYPPLPERWIKDDKTTYEASLIIYSVSDIGNGRTCMNSLVVGEMVVFYPPDGSRLDPATVEGLSLEQQTA